MKIEKIGNRVKANRLLANILIESEYKSLVFTRLNTRVLRVGSTPNRRKNKVVNLGNLNFVPGLQFNDHSIVSMPIVTSQKNIYSKTPRRRNVIFDGNLNVIGNFGCSQHI